MPRRRPPSGGAAEQGELFGGPAPRRGRVELAVDKAVRAGYADAVVSSSLDAGLVALARTLARQVDHAGRTLDPWALSRLSGELRAVLGQLRLDPTARGGLRRDEFADLIQSLSTPTAGEADDATPGEIPHSTDT